MIYGVGFNKAIEGQKVYRVYENGKPTKCYYTWINMLKRCYDPKYQSKHPTYIGTECYKEWLNFQAFAKWYENNFYEIEGQRMELDKDLLSKDNKIYSPNTCVFLPHSINEVLIGGKGYCFHKQSGKYKTQISYKDDRIYLGLFDTEEEARYTYKLNKQLIIYLLVEEYKEYLPTKVYDTLMDYQME